MGTVFLQMDNDHQGAVNRVALLYFALLLSNLGAVRKFNPNFFQLHATPQVDINISLSLSLSVIWSHY